MSLDLFVAPDPLGDLLHRPPDRQARCQFRGRRYPPAHHHVFACPAMRAAPGRPMRLVERILDHLQQVRGPIVDLATTAVASHGDQHAIARAVADRPVGKFIRGWDRRHHENIQRTRKARQSAECSIFVLVRDKPPSLDFRAGLYSIRRMDVKMRWPRKWQRPGPP